MKTPNEIAALCQTQRRRCSSGGLWESVRKGQTTYQCRCGAILVVRPVDLDPHKTSPQWFALIPVHPLGGEALHEAAVVARD